MVQGFLYCFSFDFSWLPIKLQVNSVLIYLTTNYTKITNERQNILTFLLRFLRALRGYNGNT